MNEQELQNHIKATSERVAFFINTKYKNINIKLMTYRRFDFNSLLTTRITIDNLSYIIKFPRYVESKIACDSIKKEFNNLSFMNQLNINAIPQDIKLYEHEKGFPVLIMPFYKGQELWEALEQIKSFDDFEDIYYKGLNILSSIINKTVTEQINSASDEFINNYILNPYNNIKHLIKNQEEIDSYIKFIINLCKNLNVNIPVCFEHKEFNPYNLLITEDKDLIALDFEDAEKQGSPLSDFFNFTLMSLRTIRTSELNKTTEDLKDKPTYQLLFSLNAIVEEFCTSTKIPIEAIDILFISYCLKTADLFNTEKRPSAEYSTNWYYFLYNQLQDNIFLKSLIIEEQNN